MGSCHGFQSGSMNTYEHSASRWEFSDQYFDLLFFLDQSNKVD